VASTNSAKARRQPGRLVKVAYFEVFGLALALVVQAPLITLILDVRFIVTRLA